MNDAPNPEQLLAAVSRFLREQALPELDGHTAFHARVAANVIDIVARQIRRAADDDEAERARLRALLGDLTVPADGCDGSHGSDDADALAHLNRALCERIADGRLTADTPGLADHLWLTTLAKLAVDQPGYDTFVRESAAPARPPIP